MRQVHPRPPDVSVWGGLHVPTFGGLFLSIGNFPRGLQCCVSGDRKHVTSSGDDTDSSSDAFAGEFHQFRSLCTHPLPSKFTHFVMKVIMEDMRGVGLEECKRTGNGGK